jgi:hypothetical protein
MRFCISVVLLLMLAIPAWPQASTATARGTITDQSGAVITKAAVELTNVATNTKSHTQSNEAGFYMFPGIVPGKYILTVEWPGMQKYEASFTVQVQQSAVVDVVLVPGKTTTTVEVHDVTPVLVVDNPTLGHTLERSRIEQLPINGRSLSQLLQTVPGMEGTRAFGLRDGSHEFVLDGAAQTDRLWGGTMTRQPGLDSIEEFKVEVNSSSAKFTRPTSVIMQTKSGSNQLHGALFETARNNAIGKARTRTDTYSKAPQLVRNEFGASLGGPVYIPKLYNGKNKTFFFFAYEAQRNVNSTTGGGRVLTEAMRNGDFSNLVDAEGRQTVLYDPWTTNATWDRQPFNYGGKQNNIDPARMSPVAKYLYNITPLPTEAGVNPLIENNWWGVYPTNKREWTATTRIDHRFSDNDSFYGRYTRSKSTQLAAMTGYVPTLDQSANWTSTIAPNQGGAVSWVHTFSPTLFNEVLASAQRQIWYSTTGVPGAFYSDKLGTPNPWGSDGWPGIYDVGLNDYQEYYYESTNGQNSRFNYFILDDNATKVIGKHELQFGAHGRMDQLTHLPQQQNVAGLIQFSTSATSLYDPSQSPTNPAALPYTGSDMANLYIGVADYTNQFARGNFYLRGREYAAYFQDNYKATPRLTLNLGLRWERHSPYGEKNHVLTGFDPSTHNVVLASPLSEMYAHGATLPGLVAGLQAIDVNFEDYQKAGLTQNLMTTPWKDFGPRVGFAYRVHNGSKPMVLRGGYRMSYFPIPITNFAVRMRLNAPLTAWYSNNRATGDRLSPDHVGMWAMRAVPDIIAGVNSKDQIRADSTAELGRGWAVQASYFAKDQPDPRVHDWNLTLEQEVMSDTVVRAAYVGNHGGNLEQYYRYNENGSSYIYQATTHNPMPTGEFADMVRRPFDQVVFGTIEEYRMSGWSNWNGIQLELEKRYSKGYAYQFSYVMGNAFRAGGQGYNAPITTTNQYMPGAVPEDIDARNRFINYQRDNSIPKHRVRWNWIVDVPVGKGKALLGNSTGVVEKIVGGWQIAGMGSLRSNYFTLPSSTSSIYPNGNEIETYGYKYPINDCRTGVCKPGYLWWNGYINPNQINSHDANGKPNGVMGVPDNYKPAGQPLNPWPVNPSKSDPMYKYYGTNTVFIPINDGTVVKTTYNDNLHPWRQQYLNGPITWTLDASLFKNIKFGERLTARFNADFFNVLNHPGNPTGVDATGILNCQSSGNDPRVVQFTLRLLF